MIIFYIYVCCNSQKWTNVETEKTKTLFKSFKSVF